MAMKGGLYRNPGGKTWHYQVRWRGTTKKGDTKCESRTAAVEWLRKKREHWAMEEVGLAEAWTPTLRAVWEEWRKAKTGQVDPRHILNMRCAVEEHAKAFLDHSLKDLDNVAMEKIRGDYMKSIGTGYRTGQDWTADRSHTAGGANTLVKMLSSLCGWAIAMGYIKTRPFKLPKLPPNETVKGVLWPEQVVAFILEADRGGSMQQIHSATAIRMMLGLGLRENEALGARWEYLDRRRNVFSTPGKNGRVREIPVPTWLMEHLEAMREDHEAGLILPSAWVDAETEEPLPHHKSFTQKPVDRVARVLKIKGLTPHRLRATFATGHFEIGTSISQIQQMLGHESPETTLGYIVQRPKEQAEAQEKLGAVMGMASTVGPMSLPQKQAKTHKSNYK